MIGLVKSVKNNVKGFSEVDDRKGGVVQKQERKTCKQLNRSNKASGINQSNRFDVLSMTQHESETEEVNAIDLVQECGRSNRLDVVELVDDVLEVEEVSDVDSGVARSVWPLQQKGVARTKRRRQ